MFNNSKQQLREIRTEIASLRRKIGDKDDEIERQKAQIQEMQTVVDGTVTNEDIAQAMRNKIANALKNLRLEPGFTNCWFGSATTTTYDISDVERLVVTYLAFINCTRSA